MTDQATSSSGTPADFGRLADIVPVRNTNPHPSANENYLAVRVQWPGGKEETLLFTETQVAEARARAQRNPEDIPRAAYLTQKVRDLLD